MRKRRKPMSQTNMFHVIFVCIILAPLMSAVAENLKIFIATVATIPIVVLLLFILWLIYGYSGIHLNSINVFVMMTIMLIYSAIPLFSIIWGTWIGWLTILIHLVTFLVGFINREKLALKIAAIDKNRNRIFPRFLLYYHIGVIVLGIAGIIIMRVTIATSESPVVFFGIIHLLFYYIFAISPPFLINPKRVLEMGAISKSHYDKYY